MADNEFDHVAQNGDYFLLLENSNKFLDVVNDEARLDLLIYDNKFDAYVRLVDKAYFTDNVPKMWQGLERIKYLKFGMEVLKQEAEEDWSIPHFGDRIFLAHYDHILYELNKYIRLLEKDLENPQPPPQRSQSMERSNHTSMSVLSSLWEF